MSARLFRLLGALALCVLACSHARAEDANQFGAPGRTIIGGSLGAYRSNVKLPDSFSHDHRLSMGGTLTLAHFWWRNVALGGTVTGGVSDLYMLGGFHGRESWFGADLDLVSHLPLTKHLSMRFWLWAGLRGSRARGQAESGGYRADVDRKLLFFRPGVALDLVVHVSPSLALTFGPSFAAVMPVAGGGEFNYELSGGPAMMYSFGPSEQDDQGQRSQLEDARRFGAKGRTVLNLFSTFTLLKRGDLTHIDLGFTRFITQGFGLGIYTDGLLQNVVGWSGSLSKDTLGGGIQLMGDLPIARSLSLLMVPRIGYRWQHAELESFAYAPGSSTGFVPAARVGALHHLEAGLPVYIALHLRDGLVLGVGPEFVLDWGVATDRLYVRGGVSSVIAASF